jgi:hypothetical protein
MFQKIEFDTQHDFGALIHKQPGVHYFAFKNPSSEPLTVDNVRTTCGCTSPDWDADVIPDSIGMIKLEPRCVLCSGVAKKYAKVF